MEKQSESVSKRLIEALAFLNCSLEPSGSEKLVAVKAEPDKLVQAIQVVINTIHTRHLSTITGLDLGDGIEIHYQFSYFDRIITVKTKVATTSPSIESCTSILPGAILYEMEVHDMFGVDFKGNPWMDRKLLLPDNYPSGMPPPLLKSTSSDKIRKAVGLRSNNA